MLTITPVICIFVVPIFHLNPRVDFRLDDVSKLDKLDNDVMILGDINCRTGTEDDFIDIQPAE